MPGILSADKTAINEFILKCAFYKRPVYDAYKKLCKKQQNPNIDYVDFEWKYYQFYHGNRDLTIEKSPENSSPVTLSDLPMELLEEVLNKLEIIDRLKVRKMSSNLRNLVDDSKAFCEEFSVNFSLDSLSFHLGNLLISYAKEGDGYSILSSEKIYKTRKIWKPESFALNSSEMLIRDISTLLKNPKFKIGSFRVNSRNQLDDFFALLESLNFQLQVEKIIVEPTTIDNLIPKILQYLKPGILEEILFFKVNQNWEGVEQIVEMDQWKKASRFRSDSFPYGFPIEKLMHFKTISIGSTKITQERLAKIRDILLKSTQLESLHLEMYTLRVPGPSVEDFNRIMSQDPAFDLETRRFLIPNSQDYFEMSYKKKFITNSLYIHKVCN